MADNEAGWKALERAKAKTQTEAERLFSKYCLPITQSWDDHERNILKEAALKILSSEFAEFIEENGLKGHRLHKKIYHTDIGNLIIDLAQYAHFNLLVNLPYFPRDIKRGIILKEFDERFNELCEILLVGGVGIDRFKKESQKCRKKLSARAAAGKISPYWRQAVDEKIWPGHSYVPKKQQPRLFAACRFADVFLGYVPKVPTDRIVGWVNIILESLGRHTVSKSSLNAYISLSKKQPPIPPGTPVQITE
jgi:hypothetical protein